MSRRHVRLSNQLGDLAAALERIEHLDASVAPLVGIIRRFLIPRLTDPPPPLVVAVVGSTGAGKSTLVNSLAGSTVNKPGVLRPTTSDSAVWTSPAHAGRMWPGKVVTGDHPLAESVALIDTPDLDSDLVEHRQRALEALAIADAVVFVTTSSRYGDASPWEVLQGVAAKPLVVVINRLQTRASGSRNDLTARLRGLGLGSAPVLTISEQRVDPNRDRLSHQSVQRLAGVLKDWAGQSPSLRADALERATDDLASGLRGLVERLEEQSAGRVAGGQGSDGSLRGGLGSDQRHDPARGTAEKATVAVASKAGTRILGRPGGRRSRPGRIDRCNRPGDEWFLNFGRPPDSIASNGRRLVPLLL